VLRLGTRNNLTVDRSLNVVNYEFGRTFPPSNKSPKGHANLAKLSFGRACVGISCETLEASQFPRSEIVDAIPSLYRGSACESDMHVYSALTIYNDLRSYCETHYKTVAQENIAKRVGKLDASRTAGSL
jgi:hypothetical protein